MKLSIPILIIPILIIMLFCMSFLQDKGQPVRKEKVFETYFKDSLLIEVDMIYGEKEQPRQYYSHVRTPVCKDGLCYLVEIDLYWDLLGNFVKYEVPPGRPLTKFDHDEFTQEDHEKLYEILADKTSFLRDYQAEDLIDPNIQKESKVEVDAVSGATSALVKSGVVSGAVYTSHTLWHIVNGEIADQIVQHTEAIFSDSMLVQMLQSDNYHYQYYALNHIPAGKEMEFLPDVIRLLSEGEEYVPYFAIEKIPQDVWESPKYQEALIKQLGEVEFEVQNELLNKLKEAQLSEGSLKVFVANLAILRESQLPKSLQIVSANHTSLNQASMLSLSTFLKYQNREIADQVYQILRRQEGVSEEIKKKLSEYENLH